MLMTFALNVVHLTVAFVPLSHVLRRVHRVPQLRMELILKTTNAVHHAISPMLTTAVTVLLFLAPMDVRQIFRIVLQSATPVILITVVIAPQFLFRLTQSALPTILTVLQNVQTGDVRVDLQTPILSGVQLLKLQIALH